MPAAHKETRKKRKPTRHDAWMTLEGGFARRNCTVLDLSAGSAQIKVHDAHPLTDKLGIAFCRDVRKITRCRLVWHDEAIVGVEFMVPV